MLVAVANGRVNISEMAFGNPGLCVLGALPGMAGTAGLARALPESAVLRRFSEGSRVIFPLHILAFRILQGAQSS